jgi:hypothetical protein
VKTAVNGAVVRGRRWRSLCIARIADDVDRYFGGAVQGKTTSDLIEHPQRYALSVAHLDHQPGNCDRANLKALCMPCHCRYDLRCMAQKRRLKAERLGQLRIKGV